MARWEKEKKKGSAPRPADVEPISFSVLKLLPEKDRDRIVESLRPRMREMARGLGAATPEDELAAMQLVVEACQLELADHEADEPAG